MPDRIIDCCSLLNLHAGWGGLENLGALPHAWFICDAVNEEAEIVREFDENAVPRDRELVLDPFVQAGLLQVIAPQTDAELSDYLEFAQIVDDGEAQAIALAKNRDMILLTNDRKARKLAQRADVGVATISTVDVLREWVGQVGVDQATLRRILARIQELAKFVPPKNSTDLAWWVAQFATDQA